jgi:hypothetical protein
VDGVSSPDVPLEARLATERPGTYGVQAEGYKVWRKAGVRVDEGECHVETVELEALMQREGGG